MGVITVRPTSVGVLALVVQLSLHAANETNHFAGLNKAVPDSSAAGLSDVREVSSPISRLSAVRVSVRISGEFNGDLYGYVRQITPAATNFCVLLNRPGRTASNPVGYDDTGLDITLDDSAANGDIHNYRTILIPPFGAPLTGSWQPDGRNIHPATVLASTSRTTSLSSFVNSPASGEWTLFLADLESGGTSMLVSWGLEFTGTAGSSPVNWAPPPDIVYGTALGPAQLNASSPIAGTFTYDPPAGTLLNAGSRQLSVTFTPTDSATYDPVTTNVTINVLKKSLTITANDVTKLYGAAVPVLTATYSGFVNGDTPAALDSGVSLSTGATAASPVDVYPITAFGAADVNYQIVFVGGTLTVSPAPLTITAVNQTKTYGSPLPPLTVNYSGFVNGDTASSLDVPPAIATTATASSPVGSYPITVSAASDANYHITFSPGVLYVTPAPAEEPIISLADLDPEAFETGQDSGVIRFTRTGDPAQEIEVHWTFSGTATNGSDFEQLPTSSPFPTGNEAYLTITPIDDTELETNETVIVTLVDGPGYRVGSPSSATVTIVDNDETSPPPTDEPVIWLSDLDPEAYETGQVSGVIRFSRTGDPAQQIEVHWTLSGTAINASDFGRLPTSSPFPHGSEAYLTITPIEDTEVEGNETVTVTLVDGPGYRVGSPSSVTVTIVDNDPPPASPSPRN